jgi:hypothetical protein
MASGARLTLIRATDGSTREMLVRDFFKERLYRQVGFARMFYTPVYREVLHARCVCEVSHANLHASLHGVCNRVYVEVVHASLHGAFARGMGRSGSCSCGTLQLTDVALSSLFRRLQFTCAGHCRAIYLGRSVDVEIPCLVSFRRA